MQDTGYIGEPPNPESAGHVPKAKKPKLTQATARWAFVGSRSHYFFFLSSRFADDAVLHVLAE